MTERLQVLDSLYGPDLSIQNSEEQSVYASVEFNENDSKEILLDKIDYITKMITKKFFLIKLIIYDVL